MRPAVTLCSALMLLVLAGPWSTASAALPDTKCSGFGMAFHVAPIRAQYTRYLAGRESAVTWTSANERFLAELGKCPTHIGRRASFHLASAYLMRGEVSRARALVDRLILEEHDTPLDAREETDYGRLDGLVAEAEGTWWSSTREDGARQGAEQARAKAEARAQVKAKAQAEARERADAARARAEGHARSQTPGSSRPRVSVGPSPAAIGLLIYGTSMLGVGLGVFLPVARYNLVGTMMTIVFLSCAAGGFIGAADAAVAHQARLRRVRSVQQPPSPRFAGSPSHSRPGRLTLDELAEESDLEGLPRPQVRRVRPILALSLGPVSTFSLRF